MGFPHDLIHAQIDRLHCDPFAHASVEHARPNTIFNVVNAAIGADHCRQLVIIAMVEQRVELFLHPGRVMLRTQVVEKQHRNGAEFVKAALKIALRIVAQRVEASPEPVEHFGHNFEHGRRAGGDAMMGNRGE